MYCDFYNLSEKPFDITPDPKFLYLSPEHQEALSALIYGINERRGFITLIGEVGTGKTTIINAALEKLNKNTKIANILNTDMTFEQILTMILVDLELAKPEENLSKAESISRLNDFAINQLEKDGNVAIIIDEAQNLDRNVLENLRLISNLETHKLKLIQIVLSGQPELDAILSHLDLRQFAQRVSIKRYIRHLSKTQIADYIQHRLTVANYKGSALFSKMAFRLIYKYSEGIPRKINVLCDNALLLGYALKKRKILSRHINDVVKDFGWHSFNIIQKHKNPKTMVKHFALPMNNPMNNTIRKIYAPVICLMIGFAVIMGCWDYLQNFQYSMQVGLAPLAEKLKQKTETFSVLLNSLIIQADKKKIMEDDVENLKPLFQTNSSLPAADKSGLKNKNHFVPPLHSTKQNDSRKESTLIDEYSTNLNASSEIKLCGEVIVRKGDTLSGIIFNFYGTYNEFLLKLVLIENPGIHSPDTIFINQTIKLPCFK